MAPGGKKTHRSDLPQKQMDPHPKSGLDVKTGDASCTPGGSVNVTTNRIEDSGVGRAGHSSRPNMTPRLLGRMRLEREFPTTEACRMPKEGYSDFLISWPRCGVPLQEGGVRLQSSQKSNKK